MRRFSILHLMGLVVLVAIAIAALRFGGEMWAGILLAALLGLLGVSLLGAIYGRGPSRAGWLGFLVFGGGYAALVFCPGLADGVGARLPTGHLLRLVHERVAGPKQLFLLVDTVYSQPAGAVIQDGATPPVQLGLVTNPAPPVAINTTPAPAAAFVEEVLDETTTRLDVGGNRWKSLMPGAANLDEFSRVGHGLFGLLVGLLGVAIARRFEAARATS